MMLNKKLIVIVVFLFSLYTKADNIITPDHKSINEYTWFESGAVFSEFNKKQIINSSYYAGGNSSLRSLELYFKIINPNSYEVEKNYRINFYKLLKENYSTETLEKIKQSNFIKICPRGIFRGNNLLFKVNKSIYQLNFEENEYPTPKKIFESNSDIYGIFVSDNDLFVVDKNGINHVTPRSTKSQKLKFPKIDFKVTKQNLVYNKLQGIGLLVVEGYEHSKTILFNVKDWSIIKTYNHGNSISVLDNELLLSFSDDNSTNCKIIDIKTDKVVSDINNEALQNSFRNEVKKVVLCNERFIAIETLGNKPIILIVEKRTGQVKKIIQSLVNSKSGENYKSNLLTGFRFPYLYFSKNRISLETLFKEKTRTFAANTRGSKPIENSLENKIAEFNYKALLISNQDYNNGINDLEFPTRDAEKLKHILKTYYAFKPNDIVHINNAKRTDIIEILDSLAASITPKDNLLIFYAGHGIFDENLKKGYWLPTDADPAKKTNWVSNSDIRDYLSSFKSQHTLLISDACFSGSIFEFAKRNVTNTSLKVTKKLLQKKSRKAMTSGLNKSVPDESMFIKYLLKELENNDRPYIRAGELYNEIREAVMSNTDNNPQYEIIKNANHEGGEFVFLKRDN